MSASQPHQTKPFRDGIPWQVQAFAWVLGVGACVVGMLDLVAGWSPELALVQFLLLFVAPILFMLRTPKRSAVTPPAAKKQTWIDVCLCLLAGLVALASSSSIGLRIGDLPPAYHDEYSYLFQAKTLLAGRFSFPSPASQPELFDQMHVLNEGRMASRYYPGTGIWLAPFVVLGHPYAGQWIAYALATMLIYWAGVELGGRMTGLVASLAMAISPGIGLFSNMLLAHLPTLLSLSIFLLGMIRWSRTRSLLDALAAGCGLTFAMLCRPLTAAAFGLPFGLQILCWMVWPRHLECPAATDCPDAHLTRRRRSVVLGLGIPLVAGWALMLCYNHDVTGDWCKSPYQLYTDVYTPRHVFGFNNVVRGERRLGPRVIESYDRWAQNLTPALAADNLFVRLLNSWLWTFDLIPLLLATVIILGTLRSFDRGWFLIVAAIVSLHACHIPYWYVGIMGWHYVFESAPLWCLMLGGATTALVAGWWKNARYELTIWWFLLLAISIGSVYWLPGDWKLTRRGERKSPRFVDGLNSLIYPRRRLAEYRLWIETHVDQRPALVLVEETGTENNHLDLVVNDPGLKCDVLFGRFRIGKTDPEKVRQDYPERHLYVVNPERKTIRHYD